METEKVIEEVEVKKKKSLWNRKSKGGKPEGIVGLRKKKRIAFGWYGGKYSHLDWLLPLLPQTEFYCEPFAGSAAVLINREPSSVETYNDLDGEVVNFFRTLRNESEELIRQISLTPFAREEFAIACTLDPTLDDVERARRFYIRARQVRIGLAQTASLGRWANCVETSRGGMSGVIRRWLGGIEQLEIIAERLIRVQIENRPAETIVRIYDTPDTLFYCDPPYLHSTRGDSKAYAHEMDDQMHVSLAKELNSAKGKVAISNYECDIMNDLYPSPKWKKHISPEKTNHATKGKRQEVLWVNYDIADFGMNGSLFAK